MPSETYQNPYSAGAYGETEVNPPVVYGRIQEAEVQPGQTLFPYRGMETHGVSPTVVPEEPWEDIAGGKVIVNPSDAAEESVTPVPVRIVESAAKELEQWRAYHSFAPASPARIVNRLEGRSSLTIQNLSGADVVWVGPDGQVSAQNGARIPANGELSLSGESEVWAVTGNAGGASVELAIYFEFSLPTG